MLMARWIGGSDSQVQVRGRNVRWECSAGKSADRLIYLCCITHTRITSRSPESQSVESSPNLAGWMPARYGQYGSRQGLSPLSTLVHPPPHSEHSKTLATAPQNAQSMRVPCCPKKQPTTTRCTGETGIYIIFSYCVMFPLAIPLHPCAARASQSQRIRGRA